MINLITFFIQVVTIPYKFKSNCNLTDKASYLLKKLAFVLRVFLAKFESHLCNHSPPSPSRPLNYVSIPVSWLYPHGPTFVEPR